MEERRDKEYITEATADKEQQRQAILRIAIATGIETEQIGNCIAKLEDKGYCYCTTDIEQEILEEKLQNKLRRFHASRKHLPRTAPKEKPWSWNRK